MKLGEFYQQAIRFGSERDPRRQKVDCFEDSMILYGRLDLEIKKIMLGIDIEVGELVLADRIRQRQGRLDLVISHHPEGQALAGLPKVMRLQIDLLQRLGLSRKLSEQLLEERMREVERRIMPSNFMRAVDAARILDMPFMCLHTPADNHVAYFLEKLFNKEKPKLVQDIVEILLSIPEYAAAKKELAGPKIILGGPRRPAGKICLEMTGGTEGSKEAYEPLSKKGTKTLVVMHLGEEHFKKVKDVNLNVVVAGHISSDTLGLNLLLDRLEEKAGYAFDIVGCSGFRRVRRV